MSLIDNNAGGNAPLCATCAKLEIHAMLRDGVSQKNGIPIGTLPRIISSATQCGLCRMIAVLIRQKWLLDSHTNEDLSGVECKIFAESCGSIQPGWETSTSAHRLCVLAEPRPLAIYHAQMAARKHFALEIQLLEEDAAKLERKPTLHGRRVGETVDIDLVKEWIKLCEEGHGADCEDVWWWKDDNDRLPPGLRLVDVENLRIVSAPPSCRYVALSYVWGGPGDAYKTTKANLDMRQKSGLKTAALPETITDAINLVKQLGERYLWVDALCIIQDDTPDINAQIKVMDLIYDASALTIFAAGGKTSQAPLPGLRPETRSPLQHTETIQGLHFAVPLATLGEALSVSYWDTRGWTYQERMLSRRRVFFTSEQVFWECRRDVWCEDLAAENDSRNATYPAKWSGRSSLNFPHKYKPQPSDSYNERYMGIVKEYTSRNLSDEKDIVKAISAITNVFAKGFESSKGDPNQTFQFGMPLLQLEDALLWQPTENTPLSRRVIVDFLTPSWSWAGWRGNVEYRTVGFNGNYAGTGESLVDEWILVGEDGTKRLDIKRVPGAYVGDKEQEKKRPRYKGVSGGLQESLLEHHEPGTLIFYTTSARFRIAKLGDGGATHSVPYSSPHNDLFCILSDSSPAATIGRIILPHTFPVSAPLEFIALSRAKGDYYDPFDEKVYGERYYGCLLNVMAVAEGSGGTRERVGLGVIVEGAWHRDKVEGKVVRLR